MSCTLASSAPAAVRQRPHSCVQQQADSFKQGISMPFPYRHFSLEPCAGGQAGCSSRYWRAAGKSPPQVSPMLSRPSLLGRESLCRLMMLGLSVCAHGHVLGSCAAAVDGCSSRSQNVASSLLQVRAVMPHLAVGLGDGRSHQHVALALSLARRSLRRLDPSTHAMLAPCLHLLDCRPTTGIDSNEQRTLLLLQRPIWLQLMATICQRQGQHRQQQGQHRQQQRVGGELCLRQQSPL